MWNLPNDRRHAPKPNGPLPPLPATVTDYTSPDAFFAAFHRHLTTTFPAVVRETKQLLRLLSRFAAAAPAGKPSAQYLTAALAGAEATVDTSSTDFMHRYYDLPYPRMAREAKLRLDAVEREVGKWRGWRDELRGMAAGWRWNGQGCMETTAAVPRGLSAEVLELGTVLGGKRAVDRVNEWGFRAGLP